MSDRPPPKARKFQRHGRWLVRPLTVAAALLLLGFWFGCTPQTKYKVLSTFFDGVPNPNAPTQVVTSNQNQRTGPGTNRPTSSVHKPYADQKCDACHVGGAEQALSFQSSSSLKDSNLCMKCHGTVPEAHRFMHAPVAAKACLFCHSPHESPLPHLLSAKQPELCLQCHEPAMLGKQTPEHQDPNSQCLNCHLGHGSETNRYFLKLALPATQPTTRRAGSTWGGQIAPPDKRQATTQPVPTTQPSVAIASSVQPMGGDNDFQREHPLFMQIEAPEGSGGPMVIGGPRKTEPFHIDPIQPTVDVRYHYEHDTTDTAGGTSQSFTENRIEEDITLKTTAYIIHPNFVDLKLAGTLGPRQDWIDNNGQHQYSRELTYDWDLSATILRKEELVSTLYSRRLTDIVNRPFGAAFDNTITTSGAVFDYRNQHLPVRVEVYHSDSDQTAIDQSESYTLSENVANLHSDFSPADHQRVNINYTFSQVSETSTATGTPTQVNNFDTNDFAVNHLLEFGTKHDSNLNSSLSYFDQSGIYPFERLRLSELLLLRSSETFETRYRYTLDYQSSAFGGAAPLDQTQNTFDASFTHRLYSSLITNGTAGLRYVDRSDNGNVFEYFAGINIDYHKQVPLGALTLGAGYVFDRQNNSAQSNITQTINQPHTFNDPAPITIIAPQIITSSIVVRSSNGLIVYTLGLDYNLFPFTDYVQIERVVGGRIQNGQTVLISYEQSPLPANTVTNNTISFSGRYDFQQGPAKGLGIYGRYTRLDQGIQSAQPSTFVPNSFHDLTTGLDYRIWEFTFGAEQDWHHSTIEPYDASRFYARFQHRLGLNTTLLISPTYSIYRYLQENNRSDEVNVTCSVAHRITENLTGSASISYLNLHDALGGTTDGVDANVELRWSFRQTSAFVQLRQAFLDNPGQNNTYQTVYAGIRREF